MSSQPTSPEKESRRRHRTAVSDPPPPAAIPIPRRLQIEWRLCAAAGILAAAAVFVFLGTKSNLPLDTGAAATMAVALLYVLLLFFFNLQFNHRPGETRLLSSLGAANRITFLRGVLVCILAGFWGWTLEGGIEPSNPTAWLPGGLYITAAILDGVDGVIARRSDCRTQLGSKLDTQLDAFGLLVAVGVGIRMQQLPPVFWVVGLAYYLFSAGAFWRQKRAKPLAPLTPRPEARAIAGLTMGLVAITLLPVYSPPATTIAAVLFMLPFCYGFLGDWLVVSGTIGTDAGQRTVWQRRVKHIFSGWFPLVCRLMIAFTTLALRVWGGAWPTAGYHRPDVWPPSPFSFLFTLAPPLFMVLAVSGFLGRSAALGLTLILGWGLQRPGIGPDDWAIFVCTVCVVLSGTGFFSLWQPEDRWLTSKRMPARRFELDG